MIIRSSMIYLVFYLTFMFGLGYTIRTHKEDLRGKNVPLGMYWIMVLVLLLSLPFALGVDLQKFLTKK